MNSVVEWRATTAARTGRPGRVALCVCLCVSLVRVCICVCVCVGWLKLAYSFDVTTKKKSLEN